ncbi:unnamed protein product [Dibothriocephalus latus]|uniref:Carbonic anhydrase n=1 Tax=Dibothriocephalus latus TaxID=60516 RepID=A0A3P7LUG2_DIBLA|nr:unnamed protein product [Dibothriocephalus latus]
MACTSGPIADYGYGPKNAACIEGGPLRERYILQQFHFHWGHESKWGSEHHVDGFSYSGEMHLVFLAERYSAQNDALEDPEGLCVLAVFLHPSKYGANTLICHHNEVIFFFLKDLSRYYTYEGSLTTPPCSECVRWIVCADPVEISDSQVHLQLCSCTFQIRTASVICVIY